MYELFTLRSLSFRLMSPVYGYRNVAGVGVTVGGGSPAVNVYKINK